MGFEKLGPPKIWTLLGKTWENFEKIWENLKKCAEVRTRWKQETLCLTDSQKASPSMIFLTVRLNEIVLRHLKSGLFLPHITLN